ncbi:MAG: cupin domain-containing protein, partial [Caldilineaceae bacterium]
MNPSMTVPPGINSAIKMTAQESNGALALVELTLSPHFCHLAAHWHRSTTEVIYILNGLVAFTVGDKTFTGAAGRVVTIVPRTVHH